MVIEIEGQISKPVLQEKLQNRADYLETQFFGEFSADVAELRAIADNLGGELDGDPPLLS